MKKLTIALVETVGVPNHIHQPETRAYLVAEDGSRERIELTILPEQVDFS